MSRVEEPLLGSSSSGAAQGSNGISEHGGAGGSLGSQTSTSGVSGANVTW